MSPSRLWDTFLARDMKMDVQSRQSLFLLAQHSVHGHRVANDLMNQLLWKSHGAVELRNPSAWLQQAVQRARKDVMSDWQRWS